MDKLMKITGFITASDETIKFNGNIISYENGFFFGIVSDNSNQILYGKIDINGNFEMISVDFDEKTILEFIGITKGKVYSGNVSKITIFTKIDYGQFGFAKEEIENSDLELINNLNILKQCVIGPNDDLKAFCEEIKNKILSNKLEDSLKDNLFFKKITKK